MIEAAHREGIRDRREERETIEEVEKRVRREIVKMEVVKEAEEIAVRDLRNTIREEIEEEIRREVEEVRNRRREEVEEDQRNRMRK